MTGMDFESIVARLTPVFRETLGDQGLVLSRELEASMVRGWDSLAHVSLVSAVEDEFGIRFALGELQEMRNVGDMIDLISRKVG